MSVPYPFSPPAKIAKTRLLAPFGLFVVLCLLSICIGTLLAFTI